MQKSITKNGLFWYGIYYFIGANSFLMTIRNDGVRLKPSPQTWTFRRPSLKLGPSQKILGQPERQRVQDTSIVVMSSKTRRQIQLSNVLKQLTILVLLRKRMLIVHLTNLHTYTESVGFDSDLPAAQPKVGRSQKILGQPLVRAQRRRIQDASLVKTRRQIQLSNVLKYLTILVFVQ